jgi:hypothetical protein
MQFERQEIAVLDGVTERVDVRSRCTEPDTHAVRVVALGRFWFQMSAASLQRFQRIRSMSSIAPTASATSALVATIGGQETVPATSPFAVLAAHWTGRTKTVDVPRTTTEAHTVFWLHPTPIVAALALAAIALYRLHMPCSWLDLPGALGP